MRACVRVCMHVFFILLFCNQILESLNGLRKKNSIPGNPVKITKSRLYHQYSLIGAEGYCQLHPGPDNCFRYPPLMERWNMPLSSLHSRYHRNLVLMLASLQPLTPAVPTSRLPIGQRGGYVTRARRARRLLIGCRARDVKGVRRRSSFPLAERRITSHGSFYMSRNHDGTSEMIHGVLVFQK